ncbi:MAG: ATP-dependent transcriptional regulator, MalT-like, LuxR family, partial [Anaerolineales bacterium]|nr:ATP-dependent transcriptional regulator, MalT-like, LuxR family [Anaerolineales bacterium]
LLARLGSPQPPPLEAVFTELINQIAEASDDFALVLDDYHLILAEPIHAALTFLLNHLPPQMHLVIATRVVPPLPLAQLRARGQLTELRAAELRFTTDEAAAFLNQSMELNLPAEAIAALDVRTEGWIAGLQLAALSMREREDRLSFIRAFTGSHRYIVDYLAEQVLQQPPANPRVNGGSKTSSARTCSCSRSTTTGTGIATITSSRISCASACSKPGPNAGRNCIVALPSGTSAMGLSRRPWAMRWPWETPGKPRGWWNRLPNLFGCRAR